MPNLILTENISWSFYMNKIYKTNARIKAQSIMGQTQCVLYCTNEVSQLFWTLLNDYLKNTSERERGRERKGL